MFLSLVRLPVPPRPHDELCSLFKGFPPALNLTRALSFGKEGGTGTSQSRASPAVVPKSVRGLFRQHSHYVSVKRQLARALAARHMEKRDG